MELVLDSSVLLSAERQGLQLAAQIDAEARMNGIVIPSADLLIDGTALHFGYALVTRNERHFEKIPWSENCENAFKNMLTVRG